MKMLEQLIAQGRVAARRVRARAPGAAAAVRPTRIVLRLNDFGAPEGWTRGSGAPLDLEGWRSLLVGFHQWLGPTRVTIAGGRPEASPLVEDLVRFANRLECPTHLILPGGLEVDRVDALVGRGLAGVTVRLPEPDAGESVFEASIETVRRFHDARDDWGRPLVLLAAVSVAIAPTRARALSSAARQAGADGVLGCLHPEQDRPMSTAATLQALGDDERTPHPLAVDTGEPRPLPGGARVELLSDGTVLVSSFGPVVGTINPSDPESPKTVWAGANAALSAARALARPWDEIELAPAVLLSRR